MKDSANHLTAIAALADGPGTYGINIDETSLETIQELVFFFGGKIYTRPVNDQNTPFIHFFGKIGNCSITAFHLAKNIAVINQQAAFEGFEMTFVKGAKLQIIDNQYFVLSDV